VAASSPSIDRQIRAAGSRSDTVLRLTHPYVNHRVFTPARNPGRSDHRQYLD
jgi:hypothetical protein